MALSSQWTPRDFIPRTCEKKTGLRDFACPAVRLSCSAVGQTGFVLAEPSLLQLQTCPAVPPAFWPVNNPKHGPGTEFCRWGPGRGQPSEQLPART